MAELIRLNPEKVLSFKATSGEQAQVTLTLENVTDKAIAFKVKTTAPKSYLVKPSNGVIPPLTKRGISILLIPLFEPPRNLTADRFLVQAAPVSSSDKNLTRDEWSMLMTTNENQIEEKRLSVNITWEGGASGGSAALLGRPIPTDYNQLRSMYEDLCSYTVGLEKQKKELESELSRSAVSRSGSPSSRSFEFYGVALLVVGIVILLKVVKLF